MTLSTPPELAGVTPRRLQLFDHSVGLFPPGTLVDLGAGHGMFSLRAAQAGWTVTAIDARPDRFPHDSTVNQVNDDVRQVDLSGYDLIACLGLLYHLTPQDQVPLLRRASGTPIVIDTHVANGKNTHPLSERSWLAVARDRGTASRESSRRHGATSARSVRHPSRCTECSVTPDIRS